MLHRLLSPHAERAFTALRVVVGLMFAFHGMQKVFGVLTEPDKVPEVGSQAWIGGWIEFSTGLLMALGLLTRFAAFLASGTMAVAYFQFHAGKAETPVAMLIPILNKGELAVVYCFLFLYIACRGAGPYSVDGMLSRPRP